VVAHSNRTKLHDEWPLVPRFGEPLNFYCEGQSKIRIPDGGGEATREEA
jgi:hypothetical protein